MQRDYLVDDACILGVDLGATSLRIASISARDSHLRIVLTPSRERAKAVMLSSLKLIAAGRPVQGVGLSRAPALNKDGEICDWPSRPDWEGLPLLSWMQSAVGGLVTSADDGQCATLFEHFMTTGESCTQVSACVSIGTGVAVGVIRGEEPVLTGNGSDTLAHQRFGEVDLVCQCGRRGCLQSGLSVHGLEAMLAMDRLPVVQEAFTQFLASLRSRFGVTSVVITGGGVDRFGADWIRSVFSPSAGRCGVSCTVAASPQRSALGGALLLSASCCLSTNSNKERMFWEARIRNVFERRRRHTPMSSVEQLASFGALVRESNV